MALLLLLLFENLGVWGGGLAVKLSEIDNGKTQITPRLKTGF
jgi:hypothetical protein